MGRAIDITGQVYGRLRVIGRAEAGGRWAKWTCACECGNSTIAYSRHLRDGSVRSCGCLKKHDLRGRRFGSLVAEEPTVQRVNRNIVWSCRCDCGKTIVASSDSLRNGAIESCGCRPKVKKRGRPRRPAVDITGSVFGKLTALAPTDRRATSNRSVIWSCVCECGNYFEANASSLLGGLKQSCGCHNRVAYDGLRFRSRWEMYWYMVARAKRLLPLYEQREIKVMIGKDVKRYLPDFYVPEWYSYVEIKGDATISSMKKVEAAIAEGHKIEIVKKAVLEVWCGCTVARMDRAYFFGGSDAVLGLIVK